MRERRTHRARGVGALVAVTAAIGLLVGLRSVATLHFPDLISLLVADVLPADGFGIGWSDRVAMPADLQRVALSGLVRTLGALVLLAATLATLNAVVILAEGSSERRGEVAVRSALGATRWRLRLRLLRELRTIGIASLGLGLMAGLTGGATARVGWPGLLEPLTNHPPTDLLVGLVALLCVVVAAQLSGLGRATEGGRMATLLRVGARAGADPAAVFARRALAAIHVGAAATVAVAAVALSASTTAPGPVDGDEAIVFSAQATGPGVWARALEALGALPGVEAETLAAPGALVGLGIRDHAVTECGACSRGGLPSPLWTALPDHHFVGPGFFEIAGVELLEGRDFSLDDQVDSEPVAVVGRRLARTAFEDGNAIGRRVRIGTDPARWYRVIGIAEDRVVSVLGAEPQPRETVYLSVLQHQGPGRARVVVRGSEAAREAAPRLLARAGVVASAPVGLARHRTEAASTLAWARRATVLLGLLAAALAAHGIWTTALQTTRRTGGDLAVRRAVGAGTARIVATVLAERLRITGWGLAIFAFLGTLVAAFLERTGVPTPGPGTYVVIGCLLSALSLLASGRAALEATRIDPARLLD